MNPVRARAGLPLLAAAVLAVAAGGCAKRGFPSGGPPDTTAPRLLVTVPDSGVSGFPRTGALRLEFSEPMEPKSTTEAVSLAPRVRFRQTRWDGRALILVPDDSLQADQTYILSVGTGARDRHGIPLASGVTRPFSTSDSFPPGRIDGTIEARGFDAVRATVWCYPEGRAPDSTALDFDALGFPDEKGRFEVLGLPVPGRYRVWVFADLNSNRSFEPSTDVLMAVDTTLALDGPRPRASGLLLRVVDPRAPARLTGTVLDTLRDSVGVVRVVATSARDTTVRSVTEAAARGGFDLELEAGRWTLRAYRDLDRNRRWDPGVEAASDTLGLELEAAAEPPPLTLVLRRPVALPSPP
jgi:hypothetical protein